MSPPKPKWVFWLGSILVLMGLASAYRAIQDMVSGAPEGADLFGLIASYLGWLWRPTGAILRYQVQVAVVNALVAVALALAGTFMLFGRPWSRLLAECCFWYWLTMNLLLTIDFIALATDATLIHTLEPRHLRDSGVIRYVKSNLVHLAMYVGALIVLRRRAVRNAFDPKQATPAEA